MLVHIEEQSPEIGAGVHGMGTKALEEVGAGDQGHMFGYATDETEQLMPLTHVLATQLGYRLTEVGLVPQDGSNSGCCSWESEHCKLTADSVACSGVLATVQLACEAAGTCLISSSSCNQTFVSFVSTAGQAQARKNGTCPWLRPDGKTQVTEEWGRNSATAHTRASTQQTSETAQHVGSLSPAVQVQTRKNGTCPWLRPDSKTQVTVEYLNVGGTVQLQHVLLEHVCSASKRN